MILISLLSVWMDCSYVVYCVVQNSWVVIILCIVYIFYHIKRVNCGRVFHFVFHFMACEWQVLCAVAYKMIFAVTCATRQLL